RVHQSNFRLVGFTELPSVGELAQLAQRHGLPLVDDLGSGALARVEDEPSVRESLEAGADLVCFSGDKLLGGPQAGIVVGSAELVEKLRRHPLQRAVRADKLTLAALEGTLLAYVDSPEQIPVVRMLREQSGEVRRRAERLCEAVGGELEQTVARVGGGALPLAPLELPDGRRLSVIDVPGHERFVRTMVAGATGIDLFLLVIDALEGARPQTLEHLQILRLLGLDRGVVAVTKADAADEETLELA